MENNFGFFVDDDAIKYREPIRGGYFDRTVMTKEMFIEAYNKWIKGECTNENYKQAKKALCTRNYHRS